MGNVRELRSYRSNRRKLVYLATRFWRRQGTKQALLDNYQEITTLRAKVRDFANELNEWRWKVGGVAYQVNGEQAKALVENGMAQKGYSIRHIEDADLRPIDMEPGGERRS